MKLSIFRVYTVPGYFARVFSYSRPMSPEKWKRTVKTLLIASLVTALTPARGDGVASPTRSEMPLEECRWFIEQKKGLVLDARPQAIFERGHLPGAINLPLKDFEAVYQQLNGELEKDFARQIVVYCSGVDCMDSDSVREKLVAKGFLQVAVFRGGYAAWRYAGLSVEQGAGAPPKIMVPK